MDNKQAVNRRWFSALEQAGYPEALEWLTPLRASTERIVNFGCWGGQEAFGLLWMLDATEIKIVEIKKDHRTDFQKKLADVRERAYDGIVGRTWDFIVADMSVRVDGLLDNYFDVAYCDRVLYNLFPDLDKIQAAINEMVRVIKLGGYAVAVEPIVGAEMEEHEVELFGTRHAISVPVSKPIDLSEYFDRAGGEKVTLEDSPPGSYCYRKL